jgi:hypothetical protein
LTPSLAPNLADFEMAGAEMLTNVVERSVPRRGTRQARPISPRLSDVARKQRACILMTSCDGRHDPLSSSRRLAPCPTVPATPDDTARRAGQITLNVRFDLPIDDITIVVTMTPSADRASLADHG